MRQAWRQRPFQQRFFLSGLRTEPAETAFTRYIRRRFGDRVDLFQREEAGSVLRDPEVATLQEMKGTPAAFQDLDLRLAVERADDAVALRLSLLSINSMARSNNTV